MSADHWILVGFIIGVLVTLVVLSCRQVVDEMFNWDADRAD